jgi:hypothetical protein
MPEPKVSRTLAAGSLSSITWNASVFTRSAGVQELAANAGNLKGNKREARRMPVMARRKTRMKSSHYSRKLRFTPSCVIA